MRPGIEVDITETILKIKILEVDSQGDVVCDSASIPLRLLAEKLKPFLTATDDATAPEPPGAIT